MDCTYFNFETALAECKKGKKISRAGWNGRKMYVVLQKAIAEAIPIDKNTAETTGLPEGTKCKFLSYLMFKTVDNSFVPWVASQTDLLADDWFLFEYEKISEKI